MIDSEEIKKLEIRIRELERLNLMKQFEIDFKSKMIDIAEERYGIDIWKKFKAQHPSDFNSLEEKPNNKQ